jgi:hypothetical protein
MQAEIQDIETVEAVEPWHCRWKIAGTIKQFFAVEPVISNIIAIVLCAGCLILLNYPALLPKLGKYHLYIIYAIKCLIGLQLIKAATKSLLLSFSAIALAGIALWLCYSGLFFVGTQAIWQQMMVMGILGLGISIIFIP